MTTDHTSQLRITFRKRRPRKKKTIMTFLEEYAVLVWGKRKATVQKNKSRISKLTLDTPSFEQTETDTVNAMLQ